MSTLIDSIVAYQAQIGMHHAGTLSAEPLERLEWYLQEFFQGKPVRSVETGCGASTIVFARYAARHTAYCVDDRACQASSVSYAQKFPGFRHDRVDWIYGPTQHTIFRQPPEEPVDIVLLDGPHGYPFPELEYVGFYKWLRPGGILIVDDIHIPTINNLYQFLLQDDGFRSHGLALTTAYFQRTDSPPFDMEGDGWWLQRYNTQRFPAAPPRPPDERVRIPSRLVFDGALMSRSTVLTHGFSFLDSPPLAEGEVSTVQLRLATPAPKRLEIELDVEPVCVSERSAGMTVLVNGQEIGSWAFDSAGRRTVGLEAQVDATDIVTVEVRNHGLKMIKDLEDWIHPWVDARLPNFRLYAITVRDAATAAPPTTLRRADGSIVTFDYNGQSFSFFVDQPNDAIQILHTQGRFYALDVLEALQRRATRVTAVLDVGAHVGNHSVYFEKVMGAQRVVAIEPDPRAQALLRTNCALNGLRNVDLSRLGQALGNRTATGSLVRADPYHSGGTRVRLGGGSVPVYRGDDVLAAEQFDLVKISVSGMEVDVLEGLSETISRCRPLLLVDVHEENWAAFAALLKRWRFEMLSHAQTSPGIVNVLSAPGVARNTWRDGPHMFGGVSSTPSVRVPGFIVRPARRFMPVPVRRAIRARIRIDTA